MIKYASRKFLQICVAWALFVFSVVLGVTKGFPEGQAQMAWDFLRGAYAPLLLVLTGWYFKKDIDEKKVLAEIGK